MADPRKIVIIDYTNRRGERSLRRIIPFSISFENDECHGGDTQWLLEAMDVEKNEARTYAMRSIHSWQALLPISHP